MQTRILQAYFLLTLLGINVLASPVLKELPSITYDTLYPQQDQDTAESVGPVSGPITGMIAGYTAYNALRNMFRSDPQPQAQPSTVSYILTPFRIVRDVGSSAVSMARTFASTFQNEFKNQYKALSSDAKTLSSNVMALSSNVKERVMSLPEVSNLMGTWEVPQRESNEWLEGV